MLNGLVVTILSFIIVVWIGFSMAGRDEARVSASTDLSKWFITQRIATIKEMVEVKVKRDYVTLIDRGVQEQKGYRIELSYKDNKGSIKKSHHYFYDESKQDEEFLERYIEGNQIYVWIARDGGIYVPGEIVENKKVQTIFGADRVLAYTLIVSVIVSFISILFLLFISPLWIILHLPIMLIASIVPQLYMYMNTVRSEVQRVDYDGVSALNQYGIYIDEEEEGLKRYKLVEQTLPMVLLEEGVGYLGYRPGKVDVYVDYEGNIPVHIASEYRISEFIRVLHDKYIKDKKEKGEEDRKSGKY